MRKNPSGIKEIARRAGVHHSTVSRVLNAQTRSLVSGKVATDILHIAEALGYRRNSMAVGLKTSRSFTIGVIVPDLTNPVFPPIVRAVERTMGTEGYVTVLADTDNSMETERIVLDSLYSRQVDGLILATALLNDDMVAECRKRLVPFVLVNRTISGATATSVVTNDSYGIRLAVEHLVELGHRKLAYVGGPLNTSTSKSRHEGFREAMTAHRLKADPRIMYECKSLTSDAGSTACQSLIQSKRRFTPISAPLYPPLVRLVSKQARHDVAEPPVLRIALEVSMPMHFEVDLRRAHGRLSDADVHVHALDEHADGMWHRDDEVGLRNDERDAHEVRRPQDDAPMDLLRDRKSVV